MVTAVLDGPDERRIQPDENSPLLGSHGQQSCEDGAGQAEAVVDVKPGMADKMHLFICSAGIGIFLMSIDQLLTVSSYAKIGNELNALNNTSWIATSYYLTLTSFQPLYGKLSDIFGRKECLLFAYAVFGIGCLGCGLAQDIIQLCVARGVAGIGGGGMNAVVAILLTDLVPLEDRGIWQGYMNLIGSIGTSIGGPLGGFLADTVGWRWSFIVQGPVCVVGFIAVYFVLDVQHKTTGDWLSKLKRIDFLGAITLVLAVTTLLVGLDFGSNLGWRHTSTIVSVSVTPVIFAAFIFIEMRLASNPFAPGHIIFHRSLFACYAANFCSMGAYTAILFFAPLFFQAVLGASATLSGAYLVPAMIGIVVASVGSGVVIRKTGRYYWITVWAFFLALVSIVPVALGVWFRSAVGEMVGLALQALGAGAGVTTTLIALIANSNSEDMAVVVACSYLFRALGSSIAVSLSSATLQQVLRTQLAGRFPDGDEARRVEEKVRQSLEYIKQLPKWQAEQVRSSYQVATIGAFAPALVLMVGALVVSFWIKEKVLKK